jgi:hypothetical protein
VAFNRRLSHSRFRAAFDNSPELAHTLLLFGNEALGIDGSAHTFRIRRAGGVADAGWMGAPPAPFAPARKGPGRSTRAPRRARTRAAQSLTPPPPLSADLPRIRRIRPGCCRSDRALPHLDSAASGTTAKFDCVLPDGEGESQHGHTGEIHAEIAATRLLTAPGFGAITCFSSPRALLMARAHAFLHELGAD